MVSSAFFKSSAPQRTATAQAPPAAHQTTAQYARVSAEASALPPQPTTNGGHMSYPAAPSFRFPASRKYLWDRSVQGNTLYVQPAAQLPSIEVDSRVLLAAQAAFQAASHRQQLGTAPLQLTAHLRTDAAGKQRRLLLAPRAPGTTTQHPAGAADLLVSGTVGNGECSAFDPSSLRSALGGAINTRGPATCSMLYASHASITLRTDGTAGLTGTLLTPGAPLSLAPLATKRTVEGPLSRALMAPVPPGAGAEDGFLSMDAARSLVLLSATDTQVFSVPLVGLWVRGVSSVQHPLLLAACLRFAYCTTLPDKAINEAGAFLVLLYPPGGCTAPQCYEARFHDDSGRMALLQYQYQGELLQLAPGQDGPSHAMHLQQAQQVGAPVQLTLQLDSTAQPTCLISPQRSGPTPAVPPLVPKLQLAGLNTDGTVMPAPAAAPQSARPVASQPEWARPQNTHVTGSQTARYLGAPAALPTAGVAGRQGRLQESGAAQQQHPVEEVYQRQQDGGGRSWGCQASFGSVLQASVEELDPGALQAAHDQLSADSPMNGRGPCAPRAPPSRVGPQPAEAAEARRAAGPAQHEDSTRDSPPPMPRSSVPPAPASHGAETHRDSSTSAAPSALQHRKQQGGCNSGHPASASVPPPSWSQGPQEYSTAQPHYAALQPSTTRNHAQSDPGMQFPPSMPSQFSMHSGSYHSGGHHPAPAAVPHAPSMHAASVPPYGPAPATMQMPGTTSLSHAGALMSSSLATWSGTGGTAGAGVPVPERSSSPDHLPRDSVDRPMGYPPPIRPVMQTSVVSSSLSLKPLYNPLNHLNPRSSLSTSSRASMHLWSNASQQQPTPGPQPTPRPQPTLGSTGAQTYPWQPPPMRAFPTRPGMPTQQPTHSATQPAAQGSTGAVSHALHPHHPPQQQALAWQPQASPGNRHTATPAWYSQPVAMQQLAQPTPYMHSQPPPVMATPAQQLQGPAHTQQAYQQTPAAPTHSWSTGGGSAEHGAPVSGGQGEDNRMLQQQVVALQQQVEMLQMQLSAVLQRSTAMDSVSQPISSDSHGAHLASHSDQPPIHNQDDRASVQQPGQVATYASGLQGTGGHYHHHVSAPRSQPWEQCAGDGVVEEVETVTRHRPATAPAPSQQQLRPSREGSLVQGVPGSSQTVSSRPRRAASEAAVDSATAAMQHAGVCSWLAGHPSSGYSTPSAAAAIAVAASRRELFGSSSDSSLAGGDSVQSTPRPANPYSSHHSTPAAATEPAYTSSVAQQTMPARSHASTPAAARYMTASRSPSSSIATASPNQGAVDCAQQGVSTTLPTTPEPHDRSPARQPSHAPEVLALDNTAMAAAVQAATGQAKAASVAGSRATGSSAFGPSASPPSALSPASSPPGSSPSEACADPEHLLDDLDHASEYKSIASVPHSAGRPAQHTASYIAPLVRSSAAFSSASVMQSSADLVRTRLVTISDDESDASDDDMDEQLMRKYGLKR